ncbi:hypothetical protein [Neomoorella thermoacetica]|nr:hypothetical protein [Moorella thermoacetica]
MTGDLALGDVVTFLQGVPDCVLGVHAVLLHYIYFDISYTYFMDNNTSNC